MTIEDIKEALNKLHNKHPEEYNKTLKEENEALKKENENIEEMIKETLIRCGKSFLVGALYGMCIGTAAVVLPATIINKIKKQG